MKNSFLPFSLDVVASPFYSIYTPTGLLLASGLVLAAVGGTAFLIIWLFRKNKK